MHKTAGQRPPPGSTPTPAPTPAPTPPTNSAPAPVDTSRAREMGERDGRAAGLRDGEHRGRDRGQTEGDRDGHRAGFQRCERQMRDEAFQRGYEQGYRRGEVRGVDEGRRRGEWDGQSQGRSAGERDGDSRADRDARLAADGPGRERGYQEASRSDASEKGRIQGDRDGDQKALADATRVDYPRGRNDERQATWAQPVRFEDEFAQKEPHRSLVLDQAKASSLSSVRLMSLGAQVAPSRASFSNPEEQRAYDQAYNDAYQRALREGERSGYDRTYHEAHRQAERRGCEDARRRDYRVDQQRGWEQGEREGYQRAYDREYRVAYQFAYDRAFREASDRSYRNSYNQYYNQHFERARARAYQERYDELYSGAYRSAHEARYRQAYPIYAEQKYREGRRDEAQEFRDRPLRGVEAQITETNGNGLLEPGEELRVRLKLRNFSNEALAGSAVRIELEALDSSSAVIPEARSSLVRGLRGNSLTTITEALQIVMNESAVGRVRSFNLKTYVNGRLSETQSIGIQVQFAIGVQMQRVEPFREGMPTKVQLNLKNQTRLLMGQDLSLILQERSGQVEVLAGHRSVPSLQPGGETTIEFSVIARGHSDRVQADWVVQVLAPDGRRVGLLVNQSAVPIVNDYRIDVRSGLAELRQPGVARVEYRLVNRSSQGLMRGLQLTLRLVAPGSGAELVVIGPNPQYLAPLITGQEAYFVFPVLVQESLAGATLELEVQEEGQTQVVHRIQI